MAGYGRVGLGALSNSTFDLRGTKMMGYAAKTLTGMGLKGISDGWDKKSGAKSIIDLADDMTKKRIEKRDKYIKAASLPTDPAVISSDKVRELMGNSSKIDIEGGANLRITKADGTIENKQIDLSAEQAKKLLGGAEIITKDKEGKDQIVSPSMINSAELTSQIAAAVEKGMASNVAQEQVREDYAKKQSKATKEKLEDQFANGEGFLSEKVGNASRYLTSPTRAAARNKIIDGGSQREYIERAEKRARSGDEEIKALKSLRSDSEELLKTIKSTNDRYESEFKKLSSQISNTSDDMISLFRKLPILTANMPPELSDSLNKVTEIFAGRNSTESTREEDSKAINDLVTYLKNNQTSLSKEDLDSYRKIREAATRTLEQNNNVAATPYFKTETGARITNDIAEGIVTAIKTDLTKRIVGEKGADGKSEKFKTDDFAKNESAFSKLASSIQNSNDSLDRKMDKFNQSRVRRGDIISDAKKKAEEGGGKDKASEKKDSKG